MPPLSIIAVAIIQGLTLVFPVGELTHLDLWAWITSIGARQTPFYHLVGHAGLILALAFVMWRELAQLPRGVWQLLRGRPAVDARLLINLLILLAPIALARVTRIDTFPFAQVSQFNAMSYKCGASCLAGLLILFADRFGMAIRRIEHMTPTDALAIGVAQLLVLVPGVGLISATIIGARLLGFERLDAARIAFLVAFFGFGTEAIVGGWVMMHHHVLEPALEHAVGLGIAFLSSLFAATVMLVWLRRRSFAPFAIYRIVVAGGATAIAIHFGI